MNHKGFGKIASPKKSLRQELRQVFRIVNRRGNPRNAPRVLEEISRLESSQNDKTQGDGHNSELKVLSFAPYTLPVRENFEPSHWQEWGQSAIDQEIVGLNFKSLSGNEAFEYLPDKISRRNDGRLRDGDMRRNSYFIK